MQLLEKTQSFLISIYDKNEFLENIITISQKLIKNSKGLGEISIHQGMA